MPTRRAIVRHCWGVLFFMPAFIPSRFLSPLSLLLLSLPLPLVSPMLFLCARYYVWDNTHFVHGIRSLYFASYQILIT